MVITSFNILFVNNFIENYCKFFYYKKIEHCEMKDS